MHSHKYIVSTWVYWSVLVFIASGAYPGIAEPPPAQQESLVSEDPAELAGGTSQWSVGYWTPWGTPRIPPERIEWGALTHVVYAWALVRPDGRLDLKTQELSTHARKLVSVAHAHDVEAVLGIGQSYWTGQTENLPEAARKHRSRLVDGIMDVVERYDFDGVDLDWEPFNPEKDGESMRLLAADLRQRLGKRTLSAAAIVTDYRFWGKAHSDFDRVAVMTYDLTGLWNPYSWHNSALYSPGGSSRIPISQPLESDVWSIDLAVRRFTQSGVPGGKLSIGLPFFGYEWSGGGISEPGQHWDRTPTIRQVTFQALDARINPASYRWDSEARVPYVSFSRPAAAGERFLTYDNEQSIVEKVRYAKSHRLGGWIIWELAGDYFPSRRPTQPLLTAVKNAK